MILPIRQCRQRVDLRERFRSDATNFTQRTSTSSNSQSQMNSFLERTEEEFVKAVQDAFQFIEGSKNKNHKGRPQYSQVRNFIHETQRLGFEPVAELVGATKKNENWTRKGEKLFGEANSPVHDLTSHLDNVLRRSTHSFNVQTDVLKPSRTELRNTMVLWKDILRSFDDTTQNRQGAEAHTRAKIRALESQLSNDPTNSSNGTSQAFCICRRIEAGKMIQCENCEEW